MHEDPLKDEFCISNLHSYSNYASPRYQCVPNSSTQVSGNESLPDRILYLCFSKSQASLFLKLRPSFVVTYCILSRAYRTATKSGKRVCHLCTYQCKRQNVNLAAEIHTVLGMLVLYVAHLCEM